MKYAADFRQIARDALSGKWTIALWQNVFKAETTEDELNGRTET